MHDDFPCGYVLGDFVDCEREVSEGGYDLLQASSVCFVVLGLDVEGVRQDLSHAIGRSQGYDSSYGHGVEGIYKLVRREALS